MEYIVSFATFFGVYFTFSLIANSFFRKETEDKSTNNKGNEKKPFHLPKKTTKEILKTTLIVSAIYILVMFVLKRFY